MAEQGQAYLDAIAPGNQAFQTFVRTVGEANAHNADVGSAWNAFLAACDQYAASLSARNRTLKEIAFTGEAVVRVRALIHTQDLAIGDVEALHSATDDTSEALQEAMFDHIGDIDAVANAVRAGLCLPLIMLDEDESATEMHDEQVSAETEGTFAPSGVCVPETPALVTTGAEGDLQATPLLSPDGAWWWDGASWQATTTPRSPGEPTVPKWPEQPEVWDPVRLMRVRRDVPVEPSAEERAPRLAQIAQGHEGRQPWRAHGEGATGSTGSPPIGGSHIASPRVRRIGAWSRRSRGLVLVLVVLLAGVGIAAYGHVHPSPNVTSAAYAYGAADGILGYIEDAGTHGDGPSKFCRYAARLDAEQADLGGSRQAAADFQTGCMSGAACRVLTASDQDYFSSGDGALFTFDCSSSGKASRRAQIADYGGASNSTDDSSSASSRTDDAGQALDADFPHFPDFMIEPTKCQRDSPSEAAWTCSGAGG